MSDYSKELTPVEYNAAAIKVLHFNVPKNKGCFRTHWHDRIELIRLHQGAMYVGCGTNTVKLHEGEMMILPPKMPHKGYTTDSAVKYDVLMFDVRSFYNDSELCKTYLPAIFDGRARFKKMTSHAETIQCFDEICRSSKKDSLKTTADIYRLIYLLFEYSLTELRSEICRDNTVMEMIEYIEKNFTKDLTTASVSEYFGYTGAHFCRKFKEATGLTPMNYLRIYRMEEARKLLQNGERNISEIAAHCGFSDSNYFTRCFKSHFGAPPSQMKMQRRTAIYDTAPRE